MAIVLENGNVELAVNDSSINGKTGGGGGGGGGAGHDHHDHTGSNGEATMKELQDLFSKLNPMAAEFVPNSIVFTDHNGGGEGGFYANGAGSYFVNGNGYVNGNNGYVNGNNGYVNDSVNNGNGFVNGGNGYVNSNNGDFFPNGQFPNGQFNGPRRRFGQGRRRVNSRTNMAQREDIIRRTIYVSDIDQQVTEQQLAGLFVNCGQVVDCRICGDPNSVLRFAFVEFTDEDGAHGALSLSGTMLGYYPVKVLPSKTAIAPVNPTYLPRAECAIAALNCSGVILGSLPIRVSPSKTPVRPRAPGPGRALMH
ncbi:hypothetical protein ACFE04_007375 [Oxalis oulophora]